MRIAFRVDAAPHIGSGHLMRCLTLADTLRTRGCETHFLCRPLSAAARSLVESRQHRLHVVEASGAHKPEAGAPPHAAWLGTSQSGDAMAAVPLLAALRPDWLVVDHYALDHRWQRQARHVAGRILVIDDLADRDHDCDLLLDQNFHAEPERRYQDRAPGACRRLLGPRHALLRPEFAAARARRRPRDGTVRRLLISLGGVDARNFTALALEAALRLGPPCAIDVVVGTDYAPRRELAERCAAHQRVQLHVQTDRLSELMEAADLAVGAAGASTWERLCLGLPALNLAIADNQIPGLTSLCAAGLTVGCADIGALAVDELHAMLQTLRLSPAFTAGIAERGAALVDGQGSRRVADAMVPPLLELRVAIAEDCADLHAWRNDPSVRANSSDSRPIAWEDHQRWFTATLTRVDRELLVARDRQGPVGVVRFDLRQADATVSVYLVPARQGQGLGGPLLQAASRWMRQQHPRVARLVAEIRPGNVASLAAFESAGYAPHHLTLIARLGDTPP